MRLFSCPFVPPLRGSTMWLATCQGRKGQGRVWITDQWYERSRGLNYMTFLPKRRKGYPGGKFLLYNSSLLGTWGFVPWWHTLPGLYFLLCLYLSNCPLQSDPVWVVCRGQVKNEGNRLERQVQLNHSRLADFIKEFYIYSAIFLSLGCYHIWYTIAKGGMSGNETRNWGREVKSWINAMFETVNLNLAALPLNSYIFGFEDLTFLLLLSFFKWKAFSNWNRRGINQLYFRVMLTSVIEFIVYVLFLMKNILSCLW